MALPAKHALAEELADRKLGTKREALRLRSFRLNPKGPNTHMRGARGHLDY